MCIVIRKKGGRVISEKKLVQPCSVPVSSDVTKETTAKRQHCPRGLEPKAHQPEQKAGLTPAEQAKRLQALENARAKAA